MSARESLRYPAGICLNCALWMLWSTASRFGNSSLASGEFDDSSNADDRSPQTVRRHALMLVSRICFPILRLRTHSMSCNTEVWSNTWEHTYPPRLHGDAITIGTR